MAVTCSLRASRASQAARSRATPITTRPCGRVLFLGLIVAVSFVAVQTAPAEGEAHFPELLDAPALADRQGGPGTPGRGCNTPEPENQAGNCISVNLCSPVLAMLREQPLRRQTLQFVRQSQCGFDGNIPLVCCPLTGSRRTSPTPPSRPSKPVWEAPPSPRPTPRPTPRPPRPTRPSSQQQQSQPSTPGAHPNARLLPSTAVCGVDLRQRIVGGTSADLDEFPWMVLLQYKDTTGKGELNFWCGGVLISSRYVLTAAHCMPSNTNIVSVRLGEYDTKTSPDCKPDVLSGGENCAPPVLDVPVEKEIPHPEYRFSDPNHYNDIALVRLSRDVTFGDYIRPVCLPLNNEIATKSYVGKHLVVAGWGQTENSSESSVKLKLSVPVVAHSDCSPLYERSGVRLEDSVQMCAGGQKDRDSCRGDSGGPLMGVEYADGEARWFSTGVVSFGPRLCGTKGMPGVYARVAHFVPWILDTIAD